jgi:hypothetical protein
MGSTPTSTAPKGYGGYEFKWTDSEKKVAHQAFDRALKREFDELIVETKRRASAVQHPDDAWNLAEYLLERRKQIDASYDYRYSVLPLVFAALIRAGRLNEQELDGLHEDKLAEVRRLSKL